MQVFKFLGGRRQKSCHVRPRLPKFLIFVKKIFISLIHVVYLSTIHHQSHLIESTCWRLKCKFLSGRRQKSCHVHPRLPKFLIFVKKIFISLIHVVYLSTIHHQSSHRVDLLEAQMQVFKLVDVTGLINRFAAGHIIFSAEPSASCYVFLHWSSPKTRKLQIF